MPEYASGGTVYGPRDPSDDSIPAVLTGCDYSTPGYLGVKPGADWFVNGRRYRESARTQLESGYRATLEPADAEALGYTVLRTEER